MALIRIHRNERPLFESLRPPQIRSSHKIGSNVFYLNPIIFPCGNVGRLSAVIEMPMQTTTLVLAKLDLVRFILDYGKKV